MEYSETETRFEMILTRDSRIREKNKLLFCSRWVKFGDIEDLVLIGKEVVASAWGVYINFYNLNTGENRVEQFVDEGKSDGVSCLASHPVLNFILFDSYRIYNNLSIRQVVSMFAITERRPNPRVLIFTYPELAKVSTCSGGAANGFLASVFAGTEYLVTLSSFPHFEMTLWQWRTGEKMTVRNTSVSDPRQPIK